MQFSTHTNGQYSTTVTASGPRSRERSNAVLWTIQGVLAAIFLFAGAMKLVLPVGELSGDIALPGLFIRFIGVCEVSGALGLILPGVLGIRRGLTPLAAAGLVGIMIGATVVTLVGGGAAGALIPAIVGALACYVAVRRGRAVRS